MGFGVLDVSLQLKGIVFIKIKYKSMSLIKYSSLMTMCVKVF